jgi:hypothetical protein
MTTKTVDLTPMWSDVLPAILAVITNPKASQESRKVMYEELGRMADIADRYVISKRIVVQTDLTN